LVGTVTICQVCYNCDNQVRLRYVYSQEILLCLSLACDKETKTKSLESKSFHGNLWDILIRPGGWLQFTCTGEYLVHVHVDGFFTQIVAVVSLSHLDLHKKKRRQ
jgi:hypothetical protein